MLWLRASAADMTPPSQRVTSSSPAKPPSPRSFSRRARLPRWLKSRQPELGGSIPLVLLQTEVGARTVERVLGRMEHGLHG